MSVQEMSTLDSLIEADLEMKKAALQRIENPAPAPVHFQPRTSGAGGLYPSDWCGLTWLYKSRPQ